jgi:hypothetical protein
MPDISDVAKTLGPALTVTLPSGFSGRGGDSVYGPIEGLAREGHTTGLYIYVPPDDHVSPRWPAEGFTPRQEPLSVDDLSAEHAPGGSDEPSGWPKDTVAPNPQSLNRFAYVLSNPLRYTDPTGYWCPGPDAVCDAVGEAADTVRDVAVAGGEKTLDAFAAAGWYIRDTVAGCLECWRAELEVANAMLEVALAQLTPEGWDDDVAAAHLTIALKQYDEQCPKVEL